MRIFVSEPVAVSPCRVTDRLRARWERLAGPRLQMHNALNGREIHGARLVRLWTDLFVAERSGRGEPDRKYLITESDFIVEPAFMEKLQAWPWPDTCAILARYQMRDEKTGLELKSWEGLVGAWFLALNLMKIGTPILRWPHLDWLRAAGPYNDAANVAAKEAVKCGFLRENQIRWLDGVARTEGMLGVDYSLDGEPVGCHTFFSREFSAPKDRILFYQTKPPYTAGEHVAHIERYLDQLDAK